MKHIFFLKLITITSLCFCQQSLIQVQEINGDSIDTYERIEHQLFVQKTDSNTKTNTPILKTVNNTDTTKTKSTYENTGHYRKLIELKVQLNNQPSPNSIMFNEKKYPSISTSLTNDKLTRKTCIEVAKYQRMRGIMEKNQVDRFNRDDFIATNGWIKLR